MITEKTSRTLSRTYESLKEYADYAANFSGQVRTGSDNAFWCYGEPGLYGNGPAFDMARVGWQSKQDEAIEIVDSAIEEVEREFDLPKQTAIWDVSGGSVDVGAYLSGVPECMIDYPMPPTLTTGRVVTICTSISASGSIDPEELIKRGTMIAALAMLLERMGYNTEIWADLSASGGSYKLHERILVKSADDLIDHSRILYAIANPSLLRIIGFAAMHGVPREWNRALGVGSSYGSPLAPKRDLPEGTLYMTSMYSAYSYNVKAELIANLRELGIIE